MPKRYLTLNVLDAARERIAYTFDHFSRVYVSFSAGKDSTVMLHLVADEARRRGRKVGCLLVDLEGQYRTTIAHAEACFAEYADVLDVYWVCLPIALRNAVSVYQPKWLCWDPDAKDGWIRQPPESGIVDPAFFPFFRSGMEFEEFIEGFGHWYGGGRSCACLVGIRADESLNRWRTIVRKRASRVDGRPWTKWMGHGLVNVYPIYDWRTEDIWTYFGRTGLPYPPLYDSMYRAGLSIHQMRICQPYGDDQRRGLAMWHVVEPETWARVVGRVAGANAGALYAGKAGNVLGNGKVKLPESHPTWESYVRFLLDTLPDEEREHYENKIAVFRAFWRNVHSMEMLDEGDPTQEAKRKVPSWRRVAKVILKNDRMCRGLSFSQQNSTAYEQYKRLMKSRRVAWKL
jgi:predicted phosphoadenosine phosphosulfate sulfurtransferase